MDEALDFFGAHTVLARRLSCCRTWASAISGSASPPPRCPAARRSGSRSRPSWERARPADHLYILDEPTTGLHLDDVKKLLGVLGRLVDTGNTVLVVEHHLDVIKTADWVVDLGPEGGEAGGAVIAEGTPEQLAQVDGPTTGKFLRELLPRPNGKAGGGRADERLTTSSKPSGSSSRASSSTRIRSRGSRARAAPPVWPVPPARRRLSACSRSRMMIARIEIAPGIFIDARAVPVALIGSRGGPAALMAAAMVARTVSRSGATACGRESSPRHRSPWRPWRTCGCGGRAGSVLVTSSASPPPPIWSPSSASRCWGPRLCGALPPVWRNTPSPSRSGSG